MLCFPVWRPASPFAAGQGGAETKGRRPRQSTGSFACNILSFNTCTGSCASVLGAVPDAGATVGLGHSPFLLELRV